MNTGALWLVTGIFVAVVAVSFEAGRRSAAIHPGTRSRLSGPPTTRSKTNGPSVEPAERHVEIEKIGDRSFTEVYPIIRSATPTERAAWAKAINQMPDTAHKRAAFGMFYKTLVQIDPEEAIGLAINLQPDLMRLAASTMMQTVMPDRSMGELIKLMQTLPRHDLEYEGGDDLTLAIGAWSGVDPTAAARFIEANPQENNAWHRAALVRSWASYDPVAARKWLERNPAPSAESAAADPTLVNKALLEGWYDFDPAKAADFAVENQDDINFTEAIATLAKNLVRESPDVAREFVNRLKGRARIEALNGTTINAGRGFSEMHGAAAAIHRTLPPRRQDLADWLLRFSPDDSDLAVSQLFLQWQEANREELLNWISELPAESRNRAVDQFPAPGPSEVQPELNSVLALSNVQLRDQILEQILPKMSSSRSEAMEILEKSGLSAAQKGHFISLIPTEESNRIDDDESDE